jgi:hypothetical protein
MAYRKPVSPVKDKKVFKHTADKTKKINVKPTIMRGGIRL